MFWFVSAIMLGKYFPKLMQRLARSRPVVALEGISMYVYMTHSVFVVSELSPYKHTENLLISTALFFLFSFISAIVLRWSAQKIQSVVLSKIRNPAVGGRDTECYPK